MTRLTPYIMFVVTLISITLYNANSEYVNCDGGDCSCNPHFSNGERCILNCASADSCKSSTLTCATGRPCTIMCTAVSSCAAYATINAKTATDVSVMCYAKDACKAQLRLLCGTGHCHLKCSSTYDTSCEDVREINTANTHAFFCDNCPPKTAQYAFTKSPSKSPTQSPTFRTLNPSTSPTKNPTRSPSTDPSFAPSFSPSNSPSGTPTKSPTYNPTYIPTYNPTYDPTFDPTVHPTDNPTFIPTSDPTYIPTQYPSSDPTYDPTYDPTTAAPTTIPTFDPTHDPTHDPTFDPSKDPTILPTHYPSMEPTTHYPTTRPTYHPTNQPTTPTTIPTPQPTNIVMSATNNINKVFYTNSQSDVTVPVLGVLCVTVLVILAIVCWYRKKQFGRDQKQEFAEQESVSPDDGLIEIPQEGNCTKLKAARDYGYLVKVHYNGKHFIFRLTGNGGATAGNDGETSDASNASDGEWTDNTFDELMRAIKKNFGIKHTNFGLREIVADDCPIDIDDMDDIAASFYDTHRKTVDLYVKTENDVYFSCDYDENGEKIELTEASDSDGDNR